MSSRADLKIVRRVCVIFPWIPYLDYYQFNSWPQAACRCDLWQKTGLYVQSDLISVAATALTFMTGSHARSLVLRFPTAIEAAPLGRERRTEVNEVRSRLSGLYFRTVPLNASERFRSEHRARRSTIIS